MVAWFRNHAILHTAAHMWLAMQLALNVAVVVWQRRWPRAYAQHRAWPIAAFRAYGIGCAVRFPHSAASALSVLCCCVSTQAPILYQCPTSPAGSVDLKCN